MTACDIWWCENRDGWSQIVSDSVMDIPAFGSICHAIKVSVYEYVKVDFGGKS